MKYTVDYFEKKFEKIPESDWGDGDLKNHCVLHYIGKGEYEIHPEVLALAEILRPLTPYKDGNTFEIIYGINDNTILGVRFKGKTPKQRLLNALKKVKK